MAIYRPVSSGLPLLIEDPIGQEIVCETLDHRTLIGRLPAADVVLGAAPGEEPFPEQAIAIVDLLVAIRDGGHRLHWIRLGRAAEPREDELLHRELLALDLGLGLLVGSASVAAAPRSRVLVALFAPADLARARLRIDLGARGTPLRRACRRAPWART